jgi:hypothetical protein
MADHLPVEKNVFHPRSGSDVVDNQVAIGHCRFLVHHNSDVRDSAAQAPGDQIAGLVIAWVGGKRQGRSVAAEKDHQIWYPAVIDVCVGTAGTNASRRYPLARVGRSSISRIWWNFANSRSRAGSPFLFPGYMPSSEIGLRDPDGYAVLIAHWGKEQHETWEKRIGRKP